MKIGRWKVKYQHKLIERSLSDPLSAMSSFKEVWVLSVHREGSRWFYGVYSPKSRWDLLWCLVCGLFIRKLDRVEPHMDPTPRRLQLIEDVL